MRCPDQQSLNAIAADMDTETLGPENQPDESDLHPIPDPDAHLPDAERKAIVRILTSGPIPGPLLTSKLRDVVYCGG